MDIGEFILVVRNDKGEYLDTHDRWSTNRKDAYAYGSIVPFDRADELGAKVYLCFPSGKEVEVSAEDLGYKNVSKE